MSRPQALLASPDRRTHRRYVFVDHRFGFGGPQPTSLQRAYLNRTWSGESNVRSSLRRVRKAVIVTVGGPSVAGDHWHRAVSEDSRGKAIKPGSLPIEAPCQHGRDRTGEAAAEDIG